MRSFSRLMLFSVLVRLVAAMEDSAMCDFIFSFSSSRLKCRDFLFFLSLSFRFLSLSLDEPKKDPEPEDDLEWLKDWIVPLVWPYAGTAALDDCPGLGGATGDLTSSSSSSSSPNGFSVSFTTLDLSWVRLTLRSGSS